ncbi:hypothetical protein PInf_011995 [Phytophthora infestans]|nr:hypothetical protein PInf_011995 [Phytophthora infestans]
MPVHIKSKWDRRISGSAQIRLSVDVSDRVDFDEVLLPEDSWNVDLETDEFEVEKITDMRARCYVPYYVASADVDRALTQTKSIRYLERFVTSFYIDRLQSFSGTISPGIVNPKRRDQQNLRDCQIQLTNCAQTPTNGGGPPMIRVLLNFPHLVYPSVGRDLALSVTSEAFKW